MSPEDKSIMDSLIHQRDVAYEKLDKAEHERDAALLQIDEANGRYDRAFDAAQKYRAALEKIDAMRKRLPDPDFAEQKNTAAGIAEIIQTALAEKPKGGLPTVEDLLGECRECNELQAFCGKHSPEKRKCDHKNIEAVGEGFRKCKDCGEMEPPYAR